MRRSLRSIISALAIVTVCLAATSARADAAAAPQLPDISGPITLLSLGFITGVAGMGYAFSHSIGCDDYGNCDEVRRPARRTMGAGAVLLTCGIAWLWVEVHQRRALKEQQATRAVLELPAVILSERGIGLQMRLRI